MGPEAPADQGGQTPALGRHRGQMRGSNGPEGVTIGGRVKKNAAELAGGNGFEYGGVSRRLVARR